MAGLLAAGVVAVGLGVAAALAISSGWQRERIREALEPVVSRAVGAPVRIGALTGPLLPAFELKGVAVGPEGDEIATASRLAVRLDLETVLAFEEVVIDALEIEGLRLRLRRDESGWNLPELPPAPDDTPSPLGVRIRRVRVVDSRLDVAWTREERAGRLAAGLRGGVRDVWIPPGPDAVEWGAADLALALEDGELAGARVLRGAVEAEVDAEHRLQLTALAAGGFGEIALQGRGDLDAWLAGEIDRDTRVDLAFDALDLAALTTGAAPATVLGGRAELGVGPRDGARGAPEVVFRATLDPSRVGPLILTGAELQGWLLDEAWALERFSLVGDGLAVAGRGRGAGTVPQEVDFEARVERLDRLSAWLAPSPGGPADVELAGSAAFEVHLAGEPGRANGIVRVEARDLVWRATPVGDLDAHADIADGERAVLRSLRLRGDLLALDVEPGAVLRRAGSDVEDGVIVEGLRARSEEARLSVDGGIAPDALRDLRLQLAGLHPARVGATSKVASLSEGRIDADVRLDGPFERPRVEGWLALQGGAAHVPALRETFSPIEGRVRLTPESLEVESLTVGPPGQRAELTGRVALRDLQPGRADLRLRVADFPLTRVPLPSDWRGGGATGSPDAASAPPEDVVAGGSVDADLHLTGPLLAPTVTGDLDWRQPQWESISLERISLHVEGDESKVLGRLRIRYADREILAADAHLPVPAEPGEPLDWLRDDEARVEVRGESLDLALLSPFLTRLVRDPRGDTDLKIEIRGGRPDPRIDGLLTVADGSLRVPLLQQTFSPVAGVARFDGQRLTLESLSVGPPEAGLEASGSLELVRLRPDRVDLEVELTSFPASRSPTLRANVDGRVALRGPVTAPALTGELALLDSQLTVRSGSDAAAREVRVRTAERDLSLRERERRGPGLLERASVDLALTVPGDTWIRSPELELDVEGEARLEKRSLEPPRFSGDFETRRGTVRVLGKRFALRRGEAILDGGRDLDPVLDVEAEHPVADIVVVAHLTGRASAPVLRLTSEPELPQEEVTSYLVFGRPADQLAAGEQGDVSLAAAGLAAGMALDELREVFGHDLLVDTIDVRIEEGDEPSRVEVGKYVAKDVFVRYGHTFGSEPIDEVGVTYRINENWRIGSTTSSDASAGADVYWTIDY